MHYFGTLLGIYGPLHILAVPLVADATGLRSALLAVAAALVTIPLARYIQGLLKRLTDRFLFQNRADYRQALVTIGDALTGTIKIGDVTASNPSPSHHAILSPCPVTGSTACLATGEAALP